MDRYIKLDNECGWIKILKEFSPVSLIGVLFNDTHPIHPVSYELVRELKSVRSGEMVYHIIWIRKESTPTGMQVAVAFKLRRQVAAVSQPRIDDGSSHE